MIAEQLSGEHIGQTITFNWEFPTSHVKAKITGELREVHHNASGFLFVNLTGDESNGDKTEFELARGQIVTLGRDTQ